MLPYYVFSAALGGVLLGASLFFGGDADAGGDLDADADLNLDADADVDAPSTELTFVVPFGSLRFWAFALAFGGLAGVLLTLWGEVKSEVFVAVFSVAFAIFHGSFFERVVRALKQGRVDSTVQSEDLLGERAEVTLPLSGGELGQIAVEAKGTVRHLTARLDDDGRADIGAAVWIAEVTGEGVAVVSCAPIDGPRTDLPHPTTTGRSARPAA